MTEEAKVIMEDDVLFAIEVEKKIAGDPRFNSRMIRIRVDGMCRNEFQAVACQLKAYMDLAVDYTHNYLKELGEDEDDSEKTQ